MFLLLFLLLFPSLSFSLTGWTNRLQLTNSTGLIDSIDLSTAPARLLCFSWSDSYSGIPQTYFRKSTDNGLSWDSSTLLSLSTATAKNSAIATNGNDIYVVWQDDRTGIDQIYFKKSSDSGKSFGDTQPISISPTGASNPAICTDIFGTIYIAWQDTGSTEIFYKKGSSYGLNWSSEQTLSESNADNPSLTSDNNNVYFVWQEKLTGVYQIIFKSLVISSSKLSSASVISSSTTGSTKPKITVGLKNDVDVVWQQDNKIYFKRYYSTWIQEKTISGNAIGQALYQNVAVDSDGIIYLAWADNRTGGYKVYYSQSSDDGVSWAAEQEISIFPNATMPSLKTFYKNVHLCFKDASSGQIFYIHLDAFLPSKPVITSTTHKEGILTTNNYPYFKWSSVDNTGGVGLAGYNYTFDQNPQGSPLSIAVYSPEVVSADFPNTKNGVWYLHVKSADKMDNWSETANYKIVVENTSLVPLDQVWCQPNPIKNDKPVIRYFLEKDAAITIEFFNAVGDKIVTIEENGKIGINQFSGLNVSDWVNGVYFFRIKAKIAETGESSESVKPMIIIR